MSTADRAVLSVEDLEVRYGDALALDGVSLSVQAGSVVAVLGSNGAGKSSLARTCAGLVAPSRGRVMLGGVVVSGQRAERIRSAGLVYLPEGRGIFPSLSVQENLRIAVRTAGGRRARAEAIERAVSLFPFLVERRSQRAGSLSGGEQQMLALVRALAIEPKVVIADELSLGLAPKRVDEVFQSLKRMKDLGTTMVVIEQFARKALELADTCVILRRGAVAWSGSAHDVGKSLAEHYLGA